jgi:thiamine biosynthesis lipoprotein
MYTSPHPLIDCGPAVGLPSQQCAGSFVVSRSRPAMGTLFEACLVGHDDEHLSAVAEACLSEVQRLSRRLSRFDPQSETSRLNREAAQWPVIVDYELAGLLGQCHAAWQQTDGAFDIARGLPWLLKNRYVEYLDQATQFDFGGVAKGYALDRVLDLLEEFNVHDALVHGGTSSVLGRGNSPANRGWTVRVNNPVNDLQGAELMLELCDESLSVSATSHAGHGESDLVDPFTRQPLQHQAAVVVIAQSGFEAEVMSTALLCLGRTRAEQFLAVHPELRVSVAWLNEERPAHEARWEWLCGAPV